MATTAEQVETIQKRIHEKEIEVRKNVQEWYREQDIDLTVRNSEYWPTDNSIKTFLVTSTTHRSRNYTGQSYSDLGLAGGLFFLVPTVLFGVSVAASAVIAAIGVAGLYLEHFVGGQEKYATVVDGETNQIIRHVRMDSLPSKSEINDPKNKKMKGGDNRQE